MRRRRARTRQALHDHTGGIDAHELAVLDERDPDVALGVEAEAIGTTGQGGMNLSVHQTPAAVDGKAGDPVRKGLGHVERSAVGRDRAPVGQVHVLRGHLGFPSRRDEPGAAGREWLPRRDVEARVADVRSALRVDDHVVEQTCGAGGEIGHHLGRAVVGDGVDEALVRRGHQHPAVRKDPEPRGSARYVGHDAALP